MDSLLHVFILFFVSLFPITNPFGNAAIFLSLTNDNPERRHYLARKSAIYMFCILAGFLIAGNQIMNFFGLSLEGIRIAGGILITHYGFSQLNPKEDQHHSPAEHEEAKAKEDISFSPLAMPLLAGPGAIAAVLSSASLIPKDNHLLGVLAAVAGIALTCLVSWIILRQSSILMRFLGVNGANALTKLMGFILLCIGVQLVIDGVLSLMK